MSKKNAHNCSASSDARAHAGEPCLSNGPRTAIESETGVFLPGIDYANKRILHVEPNADCRLVVSTLLQLNGYVVTSACTAEQAKEIIKSKPFDAYILDNWLPDQSGIELCRHICTFDTDELVIFYSGAAYDSDIEQGLEAGAREYLTKPCGIEILTDTVARLIHSKKLRKAS